MLVHTGDSIAGAAESSTDRLRRSPTSGCVFPSPAQVNKVNSQPLSEPVPVGDATGAQQQLGVSPPLALEDEVDVQLLVVDVDLLHAAVEVVQLRLAFPYGVVCLRTT